MAVAADEGGCAKVPRVHADGACEFTRRGLREAAGRPSTIQLLRVAWLEAGEHVRILARLPPHITSHQQLEGGGWVSIPYQSIMSHIASNQHGCQASGAR